MTETAVETRSAAPVLLSYRPWRGTLRGPAWGVLAIARTSILMLARRKIFWALFGLSMMIFAFFFYGQYLQTWISSQLSQEEIRVGVTAQTPLRPAELFKFLKTALHLDGSGYLFGNFIWFEGHVVMIVLALAGSVLVGNDFHHGSLPFYLSKPLNRWHYVAGKWLAVATTINLMTTVPAIALYVEYGLIDTWTYYYEQIGLLLGVLAYGLILSVVLGLLLLATAVWLRRTVPLVMVWAAIFVFLRLAANMTVRFHPRWRLLDLWNNLYLVGNWCMQMPHDSIRPPSQPAYWEAGAVLAAVSAVCILYLSRRIQAVEIV